MDIRNFFTPKGSLAKPAAAATKAGASHKNKRKARLIDSDSDEDSPVKKAKVDDIESPKTKIKPKPEAKATNASSFFGSQPVKQEKGKILAQKKPGRDVEMHDDDKFLETLDQLDEIEATPTKPHLSLSQKLSSRIKKDEDKKVSPEKEEKKHRKDDERKHKKSPEDSGKHKKENGHSKHNGHSSRKETPTKEKSIRKETEVNGSSSRKQKDKSPVIEDKISTKNKNNHHKSPVIEDKITPKKAKKTHNESVADESVIEDKITPKKAKKAHNESVADESVADDSLLNMTQTPADKRQKYMAYLNRGGARNPGSKEIPKGSPKCLEKLVFVLTGVFQSLEREEAAELVKKCGGKVTTSVSKNTTYMVVGEEAGPSKLEKAKKLGTKIISEDELLDLIRSKSGEVEEHEEKISPKKVEKHTPKVEKISPKKVSPEKVKISPKVEKHAAKIEKISPKKEKISPKKETSSTSKQEKASTSETKRETSTSPGESLLWTDKYAPTSTKHIIGQQGDASNVKKLLRWLNNWSSNHNGTKKLAKPSPWAKNDDGAFFKAALLSGPPGVGKTTTAHLVSKELKFDVVEMNASDTRSKKMIDEMMGNLLSNKSLGDFFSSKSDSGVTSRHVLLMDEVDGMAGNEDRGGVAELIGFIKKSKVPIICMCNDRNHQKIRSLAGHCFDLRFQKPRPEQIKAAMLSICYKEKLNVKPDALMEIINGSNQDIRQVLHHLNVWSAGDRSLSTDRAKSEANKSKKDFKTGPWDVAKKVFTRAERQSMNIHDKTHLFFEDYSFGPMFVQENYLGVTPHAAEGNRTKTMKLMAEAAESIAVGDMVEKTIRSNMGWSLLPVQAIYASVVPGDLLSGFLNSQIQFPAWFGKNSKQQKFDRILSEIQMHTRLTTSGDKQAMNREYISMLRDSIAGPLARDGVEGVGKAVEVMSTYHLLREDLDGLLEVSQWPGQPDPMQRVDSKVKSAFTRTYNKEGALNPFSQLQTAKKRVTAASDEGYGDEEEEVDDEEDDSLEKDSMIKKVKKPAAKAKPAKPAKDTKKKESTRGRKKK